MSELTIERIRQLRHCASLPESKSFCKKEVLEEHASLLDLAEEALMNREEDHIPDAGEMVEGEDHGTCGLCGGDLTLGDSNGVLTDLKCPICGWNEQTAIRINRERFEKRLDALEKDCAHCSNCGAPR